MKFKLTEVTKKIINKNCNVYDLTVENNHTYCVENIIVHNCGLPQLSTCLENSYVAHGLQNGSKRLGLIVSDGGHKTSGDVCKALCAGADFVMLGGYFSGVDCCDGEWDYHGSNDPNKRTFTYYGMSTHHSQDLFEDGKKNYRASEGTKITVPYKGTMDRVVQELLGGIRSCCCYIGASNIKHMVRCGQFCKVSKIHNNSQPILGI